MRRLEGFAATTGLLLVAGVVAAAGCGHASAPESSPRAEVSGARLQESPAPLAKEPPAQEAVASAAERNNPTSAPAPVAVAPRGSCEARLGRDGLRRAALNRTLDAGLGNWLRGVDVDPKLERGRFRGWIVRMLPEDACFAGLDLQAGDVVTRINGRRVERPEEAKDIWDGLRTSNALVVDFLRDGRPHTLRFDILDR